MKFIFLVLLISHSDIGHLNSQVESVSVSYVRFATMTECNVAKIAIESDAKSKIKTLNHRSDYTVTAECKEQKQ